MSQKCEFTKLLASSCLGHVRISFNDMKLHGAQRQPDAEHVDSIKKSLTTDVEGRDRFPLCVTLSGDLDEEQRSRLAESRFSDFWTPPEGIEVLIIDGGHRFTAGKLWLDETEKGDLSRREKRVGNSNRPFLNSWACTVYAKGTSILEIQIMLTNKRCRSRTA
jgi:hypothetical protein